MPEPLTVSSALHAVLGILPTDFIKEAPDDIAVILGFKKSDRVKAIEAYHKKREELGKLAPNYFLPAGVKFNSRAIAAYGQEPYVGYLVTDHGVEYHPKTFSDASTLADGVYLFPAQNGVGPYTGMVVIGDYHMSVIFEWMNLQQYNLIVFSAENPEQGSPVKPSLTSGSVKSGKGAEQTSSVIPIAVAALAALFVSQM